jgi:Phycobilisome degradation protein nblA
MDPNMFELSLEQQFEVQRLQYEAESLDRDQALDMLLHVAELLMIKDNQIRNLMRQSLI